MLISLAVFAVLFGISIWADGGEIKDDSPSGNFISIIYNFAAFPLVWSFTVIFLRNLRTASDDSYANLFDGYKQYARITFTMFLRSIYNALWALLLIVPGIIKYYSYSMTDYVLHDNPELKYNGAIDRSIELMKGHKMKLFMLDLSFIGWILLGILTCGIGMLWVYPYWLTSRAAFYNDLLEEEAAKTAEREPLATGVEVVAPETPSAENN